MPYGAARTGGPETVNDQPVTLPPPHSGALFSLDRVHRYHLWRTFDQGANLRIAFVGLNPSTADERTNDRTVSRCIGFAQAWGYSRFDMLNIFALKNKDPRALRTHPDPIGPENDEWLRKVACEASLIVVAWGVHGSFRDRGNRVRHLLADFDLFHLGLTAGGHPRHPLYVRGDRQPEPWR